MSLTPMPFYIVHNSTLGQFLSYINKSASYVMNYPHLSTSPDASSAMSTANPSQGPFTVPPNAAEVKITPNAKTLSSKNDFKTNHYLEDIYPYLEQDLAGAVLLPLSQFLETIFGLTKSAIDDLKSPGNPLEKVWSSELFKEELETYRLLARKPRPCKVCAACKVRQPCTEIRTIVEGHLYAPLLAVITTALGLMFSESGPPVTFFDGHSSSIHGADERLRPDFDVLVSNPALTPELFQKIRLFWPMIIYWLDVKHTNGAMLMKKKKEKKEKEKKTASSKCAYRHRDDIPH
jgi:hypothetical protein